MKHLLLAVVLFVGIEGITSAQTKAPKHKKATHKPKVTKKTTLTSSTNHTALDQRKMYHWNDGQTATPTGEQATGTNQTQMVSKDANKNKGGGSKAGNH